MINQPLVPLNQQTLSVSELNRRVKDLLEVHLPLIWVEGEISNLSKPASGHWYFTLKDKNAQIRCAMFKGRNAKVKIQPTAGAHIKVRGRVSLYEGRGDYQLIVEHMEDAGVGILQQRFEALKQQLLNEGLFETESKKPLPPYPRHLGVITSPTGAVVHDVLNVLARRSPGLPVTIIPSIVQGDDAPKSVLQALDIAIQSERFDVLLLCRGGGSLEDLWAFNNEELARAVYNCPIPIVCAVGHETDISIADFVADLRAPTPSAAAELISPNTDELTQKLETFNNRLTRAMDAALLRLGHRVSTLQRTLKHPRSKLENHAQKLDNLELRLANAIKRSIGAKQTSIEKHSAALHRHHPAAILEKYRRLTSELKLRLNHSVQTQLTSTQTRLKNAVSLLHIASPLATLGRGYAIIQTKQENVVRSASELTHGETVKIQFEKDSAFANIEAPKNGKHIG